MVVRISVERLGPIKCRSEFMLRENALHLLYGPLGTGKTYLARTIYGISRMSRIAIDDPFTLEGVQKVFLNIFGADYKSILRSTVMEMDSPKACLKINGGSSLIRYYLKIPESVFEELMHRYGHIQVACMMCESLSSHYGKEWREECA